MTTQSLDHYEIYKNYHGWFYQIHLTNKAHTKTVEVIKSGYFEKLSILIDAIQRDRSDQGYGNDIPIKKTINHKTTTHFYPA
jgi:hypothetical protein